MQTCSGILWGNCSLSASLALLPLLGLGSSLTLVLLLLLRPTCPTFGRVHLIGDMRLESLSCSYSVFQLWNLDSNVLHQRFPRWKFLFEKLSIRLLQLNLEPT